MWYRIKKIVHYYSAFNAIFTYQKLRIIYSIKNIHLATIKQYLAITQYDLLLYKLCFNYTDILFILHFIAYRPTILLSIVHMIIPSNQQTKTLWGSSRSRPIWRGNIFKMDVRVHRFLFIKLLFDYTRNR